MAKLKGFTLLELLIVVIILGILASLGLTQYTKVIEKGRSAEAKSILSGLRTLQFAYYLANGAYVDAQTLNPDLPLPAGGFGDCDNTNFYFTYSCSTVSGFCSAYRCDSGGKTPDATDTYSINLRQDGTWGGTPGYY